MIFWIKILLYSNSTSNLIIFFQNPIHSKQKKRRGECGVFYLKMKIAALAKIVWRVHDQKGKLLVLEWIDAIAPID